MTPDELVEATKEAITFVHGYLYVVDYEHETHTSLVSVDASPLPRHVLGVSACVVQGTLTSG